MLIFMLSIVMTLVFELTLIFASARFSIPASTYPVKVNDMDLPFIFSFSESLLAYIFPESYVATCL